MRSLWREILFSIFMGMVVPALLISFADMMLTRREPAPTAPEETVEETKTIPMLLLQEDGMVSELDMEKYLVGVVLAEMPASFEKEALKAQAVVARTYTAKAYLTGGKHGNGGLCTQPSCCQAYIREEDYLQQGGREADVEKVCSAVAETAGIVVTYEGELIESTYFSCSGGWTEDAVEVWGTDYPYLRSVESPGEEKADYFTDTVTFTHEQLRDMLGKDLTGEPQKWFGDVAYTSGWGVKTMEIGGESYTGTQLRALLGLRSAAFSVAVMENQIIFTTRGYGHRVGMSQYGADAMAAGGSSFAEILAWYYPGTTLAQLESE